MRQNVDCKDRRVGAILVTTRSVPEPGRFPASTNLMSLPPAIITVTTNPFPVDASSLGRPFRLSEPCKQQVLFTLIEVLRRTTAEHVLHGDLL